MKHLLKSHNVYWCKDPVKQSIEHGCDMIETDICWFWKKIRNSHSWKPFHSMYYGSLEDVFLRPLTMHFRNNPDSKDLWLMIEFKHGSKKINKELVKLLRAYKHLKLKIAIFSMNSKCHHKLRYKRAKEFYEDNKNEKDLNLYWYNDLLKEYHIGSDDLYEKEGWK